MCRFHGVAYPGQDLALREVHIDDGDLGLPLPQRHRGLLLRRDHVRYEGAMMESQAITLASTG